MKKQTGQKEIMKKVLDYIRPQWLLVLLSLLMAVVSVALTLYLFMENKPFLVSANPFLLMLPVVFFGGGEKPQGKKVPTTG